MEKYNNISYTFKQAKRMIYTHKGKLQMGLPEWDEGESIRVYYKPDVKQAIYEAEKKINPELPRDYYYLPDNLFLILEKMGRYTEQFLGDIMTSKFLYKHVVHDYGGNRVVVKNEPWSPNAKEMRRRDWILYKL